MYGAWLWEGLGVVRPGSPQLLWEDDLGQERADFRISDFMIEGVLVT